MEALREETPHCPTAWRVACGTPCSGAGGGSCSADSLTTRTLLISQTVVSAWVRPKTLEKELLNDDNFLNVVLANLGFGVVGCDFGKADDIFAN